MIIGLMGGVGCGKSTVMNYLKQACNAYIIEADKVAKDIMTPGNDVFNQIAENFPEVINNGVIDSNLLANIVFNNQDNLETLNSITHPGTIKEILDRIKNTKNQLIVVESAILLGSGIEEYCDELWFVYCDLEKRIERLIKNRGYTREKCISIINKQPTDEEYNNYADEYIDNSGNEIETKEQLDYILSKQYC